MGALVPSMDQRRMGVFNARYYAWQLVGLLRTRLGRLVVLGSSGKCLVYAMVGSNRPDAQCRGDGKTGGISKLDAALGNLCFFS